MQVAMNVMTSTNIEDSCWAMGLSTALQWMLHTASISIRKVESSFALASDQSEYLVED